MKTPGQIAYEAHATSRQGHIKLLVAQWVELPAITKGDWEVAAHAVIDSMPCQHPAANLSLEASLLTEIHKVKCTK